MTIKSPAGKVYDVAADFSTRSNPNGPWSYGWLAPGPKPDPATFALYTASLDQPAKPIGSMSNPGSEQWEDVLADQHPYQQSPQKLEQIRNLRDCSPDRPVFISEYGLCSAIDLVRQVRHYEQIGQPDSLDARYYRDLLDKFMVDWQRFRMADTFGSPEEYFRQCVAKMAALRLQGLNAIRAESAVRGPQHDRHLRPRLLRRGHYGLRVPRAETRRHRRPVRRLCPAAAVPVRRAGQRLSRHEGAAGRRAGQRRRPAAGQYPVRLLVVGPDGRRLFEKTVTVTVADPRSNPPLAAPILHERIAVDGPSGRYRFLAAFEKGGAAAGGNVEFYVADPADMPKVETEIVRWGDDAGLDRWLAEHGIKTRPFAADRQDAREVILVGQQPAGGDAAWRSLARHIARGSTAVFLCPAVFAKANNPVGWTPLVNKGQLVNVGDWLYPHDPWTKKHPIFDGLPCGNLMDYVFYREVISGER